MNNRIEKLLINMYNGGKVCGYKEGKHRKGYSEDKNRRYKMRIKRQVSKLARRINRSKK